MPTFRPSTDLDMYYQSDDFTDPWRQPQTILMLHGNAESGLAWYAWVPKLARQYRVVRPDMRGFGESTAMPREYPWTLDRLVEDFCLLMDHLGIDRVHLIGAKIGGTIARAFAGRRPERVMTLSLIGTPAPLRVGAAERVPDLIRDFEMHGVEYWARQNMGARLGSAFPPEGFEWWTKFMGRTAVSTQIGFMGTIACADIRADLPRIRCPTLVVTTEQSGLGTVEDTRAWQQQIARSELLVLPGNSYHVAATHADLAADAVMGFIARHGVETS
jgi:3-oxoadipate enol-lactonase